LHVEISRKKESAANYSGDGPTTTILIDKNRNINSERRTKDIDQMENDLRDDLNDEQPQTFQSEISIIQRNAKQLNGINISKNRINLQFKIDHIDNYLLSERIPNHEFAVGDVITKINGIELYSFTTKDAAEFLATNILFSVERYSVYEWNRLRRENIRNENFRAAEIDLSITQRNAKNLNGINISKNRMNSQFKIDLIDNSLLSQRIPNHEIAVGDVITKINGIELQSFTTKTAAELLSTNILFSIQSYAQNGWNRERREVELQLPFLIVVEWDYDHPCQYCNCLYLKIEKNRNICCNNGAFLSDVTSYPKLLPLPPRLRFLCVDRCPHFSRNSISYNNILALGATGIENGSEKNGWELRFGDHCVTLHGRTYHFLTNSAGMNGLHYFLYDAQLDMMAHADRLNINITRNNKKRVIPEFLESLFIEMQEKNILAQEVEMIGNITKHCHTQNENQNILVELNTATSHFDVAAISSDVFGGNRVLTIRRKGSLQTNTIHTTDSKLEPLSYPLLFPYGEDGWGEHIRKAIKFPKYLLSRMLMGEKQEDGTTLLIRNKKGKLISVNRFQLMSRLGQTYLVDNLSRAIDYRLAWHKKHQKDVFGVNEHYNEEHHSQESQETRDDETSNEQTFLSQSCHGSRRHLRRLSANALSIVSEYGRPSVFITLTCNAYWDEITEQLLESQA